jgi:hypothetical protein
MTSTEEENYCVPKTRRVPTTRRRKIIKQQQQQHVFLLACFFFFLTLQGCTNAVNNVEVNDMICHTIPEDGSVSCTFRVLPPPPKTTDPEQIFFDYMKTTDLDYCDDYDNLDTTCVKVQATVFKRNHHHQQQQ